MSKKFAALSIGILVCIYGTPVLAANSSSGGQSSGTSQQTQQQTAVSNQGVTQQVQSQTQVQVQTQTMTSSPTGMQVQNQNQVETQNQGEDQSLQVVTQEQEKLGTGEGQSQGTMQGKSGGQEALISVDAVTGNLDSILTVVMAKGSPGEKIQTIAQAQSDAQKTIKMELQKIDDRKGLMKSLIGPDYRAMKVMTQQMEQNQLRISELEQLKTELVNQGDITMVQEAIQTLTDQNTALQDKLSFEEQTNSLLGWLFRFFAR